MTLAHAHQSFKERDACSECRAVMDEGRDDCQHRDIRTWAGANVVLWACHDCKLRFYPACRECVDVGHRDKHP